MINCLKDIRWLVVGTAIWFFAPPVFADSNYYRFSTNLGNIDVQLTPTQTPATVANFKTYVSGGSYTNSIFHRISDTDTDGVVVAQGGAFYPSTTLPLPAITTHSPVLNEPGLSNVRGTLGLAKLGGNANSGTSQWYFNLTNNTVLDLPAQDGGFTVFGMVANQSSLAVMDLIGETPTFTDGGNNNGGALTQLPLINYTAGNALTLANFVTVTSITPLTVTEFTTWQSTYFSGQPANISDPAATPQNDGTSNLVKYLCDVTPMQSMPASDRAKLPTVSSTTVSGVSKMVLTYRQRPNLVGVFVNVQTCSDLSTWATATNAVTTQTPAADGTNELITKITVPAPATGATFMRLSVTQAQPPVPVSN